jgi:hypothetical protein
VVWIPAVVIAVGGAVFWMIRPHTPTSVPQSQNTQNVPPTLTVEAPAGSTTSVRGQDFSSVLRASGGLPPIRWRIGEGSLPPGLGLNSNTGSIAGKPLAGGAFVFTAMALDSAGNRAERKITIAVEEPVESKQAVPAAKPTNTKSQKEPLPQQVVPLAPLKQTRNMPTPDTAPPLCKATTFALDQYGDSRTGQLTWTGTLPARGPLEIQNRRSSSGNLRGDILPKGVPVRISIVPDTIRVTTAPSAVNCWDPKLVLLNSGQTASEIRIRWEVFQP